MTIKEKILADERVDSISDERYLDDGYWVILKDGYHVDDCSCIHESSPSACFKRFWEIEKRIYNI